MLPDSRQASVLAPGDTYGCDGPYDRVQGAILKYDQTSREPSEHVEELSIEDFAAPSELRGAHNFASAAQPIASLAVQSPPPPLSQDRQAERHAVAAELAKVQTPVANAIPETDFLIETRLSEPDPPFRTPSSWQTKQPVPRSDRHWNWSERSTAAFLGFAAGILIIVPLVFFISTTSQPVTPTNDQALTQVPLEDAQPLSTAVLPVKTVAVANVSASSWLNTRSPAAAKPDDVHKDTASTADARSRARRALDAGRTTEARAALRTAASPDAPQLWFMLAETYDPLAAKRLGKPDGTPAVNTKASDQLRQADIKFARYYYQQALTHGVETARNRLAALPKP